MSMTLKNAIKVAKIIETAEGGCGGCINEAVRELEQEFPEFKWEVKNIEGFNATIEVTPNYKPAAPSVIRQRFVCR